MSKKALKIVAICSILLTVFCSSVTLAADPTDFKGGLDKAKDVATSGGLSGDDVPTVISNILKYTLGLVGVVAVVAIIYGGFLYLTSTGDDKKATTAKNVIIFAVIGIIVVGLAAVIVNSVLLAVTGK